MTFLGVVEGSLGIYIFAVMLYELNSGKKNRIVGRNSFFVFFQTDKVARNGIQSHFFSLFKIFTISDTSRQRGNNNCKASFWFWFENKSVAYLFHKASKV